MAKHLSYFSLIITRWLAHYYAISWFLDIEGAMIASTVFGLVEQKILLTRQEMQRSKPMHVRCSDVSGPAWAGLQQAQACKNPSPTLS
jgi:hypothetical protein